MWVIMNFSSPKPKPFVVLRPSSVRPQFQTTASLKPLCRLQPWEIAVYLAVAGDVFDGVFFFVVLSFFPRDILDEILVLIESVSEGFPTYSFIYNLQGL